MNEFWRYLAAHHGVFTRAQAREFGLSDRQITDRRCKGLFTPIAPRVYRLSTAPATWEAQARGEALSARGLVSATAALRTWAVDGQSRQDAIHILVHHNRYPRSSQATLHRTRAFDMIPGYLHNGIPVTSASQAVLDAAALVDPEAMESIIDAVVRQKLATVGEMLTAIEQLGSSGRKGLGTLRAQLLAREPGARVPDSKFNRLVAQLLVGAGLPEPVFEYEVRHRGRFVGRADLAYPEAQILIELDSAQWHHNHWAFVADPRRKNRLTLAGYQVLSFTWDDYVKQRAQLIATVYTALNQRLEQLGT